MKCSACGEENTPNSRFCSACGARIAESASPETSASSAETVFLPETSVQPEAPAVRPELKASDDPVQPFSDNPFQSNRISSIYGESSNNSSSEVPPVPPRPSMFLFDDEKEEEAQALAREQARLNQAAAQQEMARRIAEDPFYDQEEEEEDYDDEDDSSGRVGKIIVAVISIITVLILVIGAYAFFFHTSIGSRLRAYYNIAADADDYAVLAEWQQENGSKADASDSWYNAFLLKQDDYDFSLRVAQSFEECGDLDRAEQMYMYLIDKYPDENDPYDYLMALLVREQKTDAYNALITYRQQHQSGFVAPQISPSVPVAPTSDKPAGQYSGTVKIILSAEPGAEIHFTLDGSTPTAASTRYSVPLALYTNTYTLKAIAIVDGISSPVFEAVYVVT